MKKIILILILVLSISVGLAGCKNKGGGLFATPKLDAPSNVILTGYTLTWDTIDNADRYVINVDYDDGGYIIPAVNGEFTLKEKVTLPGTYIISVKAISGSASYLDSDLSQSVTYYKGEGTLEDPILISSVAELESIGRGYWTDTSGETAVTVANYYKLTNDIDIEGNKFNPIGGAGDNRFEGIFDGAGFTISNAVISDQEEGAYFGIFKGLLNASVYDLNLSGITIDLAIQGSINIGFVAGKVTNSTILNCTVDNSSLEFLSSKWTNTTDKDSSRKYIGGIAGSLETSSIVGGCSVTNTNIRVETYYSCTGGIIGHNNNCTIDMSATNNNQFESTGQKIYLGGIAGKNYGVAGGIFNSYSIDNLFVANSGTDTLEGVYRQVGLLAGHMKSPRTKAENCYAVGEIQVNGNVATDYVGCLGSGYDSAPLASLIYDNELSTVKVDEADAVPLTNDSGYYKSMTNVIGVSTSDMKLQATYVGFDFENTWAIATDVNNGYPTLVGEYILEVPEEE